MHGDPAAEGAGHAGGEEARAGHEVEALAAVGLDGGRRRRRPLAAEHADPVLRCVVEDDGRSPPGPFRCGSTTCSTKPPATAASKALPPFSSMLMATAEAIQWVELTTPKVPRISGRVVKPGILLASVARAALPEGGAGVPLAGIDQIDRPGHGRASLLKLRRRL